MTRIVSIVLLLGISPIAAIADPTTQTIKEYAQCIGATTNLKQNFESECPQIRTKILASLDADDRERMAAQLDQIKANVRTKLQERANP